MKSKSPKIVLYKVEMNETTLIIQGKLMSDTYRFYCERYPDTKKVFCTWENNEIDCGWRDPSAVIHSPKDVFLRRHKHERFSPYDYSLELQVLNTLESLDYVDTRYVIRLRGDEWYSNLHLMAKEMEAHPETICTIPAFFKKWNASPFHASDHVIAGETKNIRIMFQKCLVNMIVRQNDRFMGKPLSSVGMLYNGFVNAKSYGNLDKKAEFKRMVRAIPMDNLKYYKVYSEDSGMIWYSNFDPRNDGTWEGSISSMEEL